MRGRIELEESAKKRFQDELHNVQNESSNQEVITELRQQFENHLQKLQQEHDQELEEEKQVSFLSEILI